MPSTFASLLLFLVCLAPGFVYATARDARFPERVSTVFRETTRVVLASLAFDAVALAVFSLFRAVAPGLTVDIPRWIDDGWHYVRAEHTRILVWSGLLLLLAMALAVVAARVLPRRRRPLALESAWWLQFRVYPDEVGAKAIHVACELVDGSYVSGTLKNFAHQADETNDRDLTLAAPLDYRASSSDPVQQLRGHQLMSVSAQRIKFLTVTYLDHVPEGDPVTEH
jgi:hypothetical protein